MNHINITNTFESNIQGKMCSSKGTHYRPYILQEFCAQGDIFNYLFKAGAFSEQSSKCIFAHLLDGLHYLKSQNKSHLDIKPENILVTHDGIVKLADFGFMTACGRSKAQCIGTQGYNAPQIAEGLEFETEKADLFSLGALMITVLMRNPLFVDTDAVKDYNFN